MVELSVIIPIYNSQATIIEAIESVVKECLSIKYEWEVILVNDGSSDDSLELVTSYVNNSPNKGRIQVITQENRGVAVARNRGIKASSGRLIAFNDADDVWLEGKLSIQLDYLMENEDVVLLGGLYGSHNMFSIKKHKYETIITIKNQVLKCYFSPPTTIVRKSIIDKVGLFDENMRYAEEGFFFNKITYEGKSVLLSVLVADCIIKKRAWGDSGLSGNLLAMEKGELHNITQAYNDNYISIYRYVFAICFSIAKFLRRLLISKYSKLWK